MSGLLNRVNDPTIRYFTDRCCVNYFPLSTSANEYSICLSVVARTQKFAHLRIPYEAAYLKSVPTQIRFVMHTIETQQFIGFIHNVIILNT